MKERKFRVVVAEDGRVVIEDETLRSGQQVDVVLRVVETRPLEWPLHGLPVKIHDPFGPAVKPDEWDAER